MKHHFSVLRTVASLICIVVMAWAASAQTYVNKEWAKTNGAPASIDWTATALDLQGNIFVVGNTQVAPGNTDVLVSKYSRDGELLWQQGYHGSAEAEDYGVAVTTDASGNCFVAATVSNLGTSFDVAVLKFNPDGALAWHTEWNGGANLHDVPSSIALDGAGNVYVAGTTYSSATNPDYLLIKINSSGAIQWYSLYDYAGFPDVATGISFDPLMDPVVTGGSASAATAWDYATVRYNKVTGAQNAVNRVVVPGVNMANALAFSRDNSGNLYITGYTEASGNKDIQTVKIDNAFTLAWVQNFDGEGLEDMGKAIGPDNMGNVYVAGHTHKASGGSDFITIKYDAAGNILWKEHYRARKDEWKAEATKLAVTSDGGVIVVGTIFDGQKTNFMTIKYNPDGKLEWEKEYDGLNGDDKAKDVRLSLDGKVYVTGTSGNGAAATYSTVKYSYLKKDNGIVYDDNGDPYGMGNELIVKFRPSIVNTDVVDDRGWEYGSIAKVIGDSLAGVVAEKLGLPAETGPRLTAYKIFKRFTTADSTSLSRIGEHVRMPEFWSYWLIGLPAEAALSQAIDSLSAWTEAVESAEPNYVGMLTSLPNDPLLDAQASLIPTVQYPYASINLEPAWAVQKGRSHIKVAVFDSPVYWAHEDFGDGTYSGSKVEGGWDFYSGVHISNINHPARSHGTSCAGIIGALSNNNKGIAGIAGGDVDGAGESGVSLVSMGIVKPNGDFISMDLVAPAIVEAAASTPSGYGYGVHVQNHSWGGPGASGLMSNAIRSAAKNGCTIVAGRGNNGNTELFYPACYRDEYVLNVGASGKDGNILTPLNGDMLYSSWGGNVDVVAPGAVKLVTSTVDSETIVNYPGCEVNETDYACFRGTSAATPHVAGVAALLMSEHNTLDGAPTNLAPEDVEFLIQRYAVQPMGVPAGYGSSTGWGLLNAGNVMAHMDFPAYWVEHSGQPSSRSTSVVGGEVLVSIASSPGLAAGYYYAEKVEVLDTYHHVFPNTVQVLNGWGRIASTIGVTTNTPVYAEDNGTYSFAINGNEATVTARTYTWLVKRTMGGQLVNVWLPYSPSQLKTAYSLHLHDATLTSVAELETEDLRIYPSPAADRLTISLGDGHAGPATITVYSVTGAKVLEHQHIPDRQNVVTIPVSSLSAGVYVVRVASQGTVRTNRFIKG